MLGVPYGDAGDERRAGHGARAGGRSALVADEIVTQGGPGLEDKKVIALVAYLQRLGTDISRRRPGGRRRRSRE